MDTKELCHSNILWSLCIVGFATCALMGSTTAPPAPGNAALVYYQAFLLFSDASLDDVPPKTFRGVFREPNLPAEVREYVSRYDDAIDLIRTGSRVEHCDWGINGLLLSGVPSQLGHLSRYAAFLLCSSARILAADGDYAGALADCLVVRRLAAHLSDGTVILLMSGISLDGFALQCIQQILGVMPPDEEALITLREQINSVPVVSDRLWMRFDKGLERDFWRWRTLIFPRLREGLLRWASDRGESKRGSALSDDDLLQVLQEPFAASLRSIHDALAKGMPYEETHATLERLAGQLRETALADRAGFHYLYSSLSLEGAPHLYNLQLAHRSNLNAILTAIEIYRASATSGHLPQELPDGLPGDPYSGKPFGYERTAEGFVLRGRVEPTDQTEPWKYEFKVVGNTGDAVVGYKCSPGREERGQALQKAIRS